MDGTSKPIEKIQSGDMVLAVNHEHPNSTPKPCRITRVFHNAPQATWKLTLTDGQTIQCTKEHPFYVIGRGWTSAEDLFIGDHLLRPDGSTITLSAKEYVETVQPVFNFEVENAHTYFVGKTSDTAVLVHNSCFEWLSNLFGSSKSSENKYGLPSTNIEKVFDQLHIGFEKGNENSGYYLVVFTRASAATGHAWLGLINRRDSTQNIYRGITLDGLRTAIATDHKDDYYEVARWYPITRHYYQYLLTCPEPELGKESYYASTNQNCTTWTRERAKSINVDIVI